MPYLRPLLGILTLPSIGDAVAASPGPAITIEKSTNDADSDIAPGPYILAGDPVG